MSNETFLEDLLALFPGDYLQAFEPIEPDQMPEPYRGLLVHELHMTVTVEAHHGSLVDVQVLETRTHDDSYSRKILLALKSNGRIVLFGLVRIHLNYCSQVVRDEILSEKTPLGRILINHDVLRRIEPTGFLKVNPGPELMRWFGLSEPTPAYGRTAIIHCDDQPAVELLEIVTPECSR